METTATKDVRLILTRPRAEIRIELERDDTCTDALKKAGKDPNDYYIINPKTQVEFQPTEELWDHIQDGGKFHVVPQSEVAHAR